MSQTIYSGNSVDLSVATGLSLGVFVTKGAYSLAVKSGVGKGTSLAASSTTSQNYGPWASAVVVTLRCEVGGEIAFDVAAAPVDDRDSPNVKIKSGVGSPEGIVSAPVGAIYLRTDGGVSTTLYVKQSGGGNTGWVAK